MNAAARRLLAEFTGTGLLGEVVATAGLLLLIVTLARTGQTPG